MRSDLDIWAIQYYPKKLYTALNRIEDGVNIIYSNVISHLELNNVEVLGRYFNTVLYNDDKKIMIMLMDGCIANKSDIVKYLSQHKKTFVEVKFMINRQKNNSDEEREFWFVKDEIVLEEAVKNSFNKSYDKCKIDPNVKGSFDLSYKNNDHKKMIINKVDIKGVIEFKDKVILLLDNDINYSDVLKKYDIRIKYLETNNKVLKKTYKKF